MATTFTARSSHLSKVLRNTGTDGTPTWVTWSGARDVTPNSKKVKTHEVGDRSRLFEGYIRGRKTHDLAIECPENYSDANFLACFDAFWAADDDDAAVVYLAVLNRAIADVGCIGIKGPYIIAEMSDPYPVDGVQMVTFTFQPAAGAIDLQKVKITA